MTTIKMMNGERKKKRKKRKRRKRRKKRKKRKRRKKREKKKKKKREPREPRGCCGFSLTAGATSALPVCCSVQLAMSSCWWTSSTARPPSSSCLPLVASPSPPGTYLPTHCQPALQSG